MCKFKKLFVLFLFFQISIYSINSQQCQPSNICQDCSNDEKTCLSCFPNSTFYLNDTTSSCDTCSQGCRSCISNTECQVCFEEYFLNSTSKLCQACERNCTLCGDEGCITCGEYTFLNDQKVCQACAAGCMACENNSTCHSDACIQWGYFYDENIQSCSKCQEGCMQCSSYETCLNSTSCKLNYFFDENTNSCSQCSEGCLKCNDPQTCFKEYCDVGYKFNYRTLQCESCNQENYNINCQTQVQNSSEIRYQQIFTNNLNLTNVTYSHMSMIEYLPNNTIVVAFQGSAFGEGNFDQSIYLTFSYDYGQTWTPFWIIKIELYAMWGPVLYWCPIQQKLWLFYAASVWEVIRGPYRTYPGGSIKYITSTPDSNFTNWSSTNEILAYADPIWGTSQKMTANKMISFEFNNTQRWVLPFWIQVDGNYDPGQQNSGVIISDDLGKTWYPYGPLTNYDEWLIENSVAIMNNQQLYQVFRTSTGAMWESFSSDFGITWTEAQPSEVDNPDSKFSMITLDSEEYLKAVILTYNPSKKDRTPLSLAYTMTDAQTWVIFAMLEDQQDGYFAYPTSQQIGNKIYSTYTTNYGIKMAIADIPEILLRKNHQKSSHEKNNEKSWLEYLEYLLFEDHTKDFFEKQ